MECFDEMYNFYQEHEGIRKLSYVPQNVNILENPIQAQSTSNYRSNAFEFWKVLTDNEVPDIIENRYWISSFGNTWDNELKRPIPIICSAGNKFYEQINLRLKTKKQVVKKMHRLIMMLFDPIEGQDKLQVNHIDGSHNMNNLCNLEWCDDLYNRLHSIVNGVGTNNFSREIIQLTPNQVHKFKELKDQGYDSNQIYYQMMSEMQNICSYNTFYNLLSRISLGQSKLYSRYYF